MKLMIILIILLGAVAYEANQRLNASQRPTVVESCYQILKLEFEDGSAFYKAVSEKLIRPLSKKQNTKALAKFLEISIVQESVFQLDGKVCKSIEASL